MTLSQKDFAQIRFGYGFSPYQGARLDALDLYDQLVSGDKFAGQVVLSNENMSDLSTRFRKMQVAIRKKEKTRKDLEPILEEIHKATFGIRQALIARSISDAHPMRERLVQFWMDHFTVPLRGQLLNIAVPAYLENAIRPNVTGQFGDLLRSAITHPAMVFYLDNHQSRGPNSKAGKNGKGGLNENLAREVLELHTIGVDGGYSQTDVTQLAELFTGLRVGPNGTAFQPIFAEPGSETVLGKTYGGGPATMEDIDAFIDDIAQHPKTAQHIAHKLVRHFVSDEPDDDLVDHLSQRLLATNGNLISVYEALLEHPKTWLSFGGKVKQPLDFLISSMRLLGVTEAEISALDRRDFRRQILGPLILMGQDFLKPRGPDGWAEEAHAWITPNGLAGRVQWAAEAARKYGRTDPRKTLEKGLGAVAGKELNWAVPKAESRADGLSLILASPEFNRR